ncbi:unnamed protein product [Spirodela intermedia]|uniref:Uncharacterized protein n=1 Tax=Spirodela intermedia TaxID=51605 RepID=A0A7I8LKL5_SPIIN|nr:unnamed protein product [Spirodela intermedia]CAA7410479.1 unnamed protein product [Spirodela intermedia]
MGRRAPARDEVVLLGPCGDCILTVRRKCLRARLYILPSFKKLIPDRGRIWDFKFSGSMM